MKKVTKILRNQEGFTLIEIITVLIILGILASVAIPRYLDMQTQAQINAAQGAIAAGESQVAIVFATCAMMGSVPTTLSGNTFTTATGTCPSTVSTSLGDFTLIYGGTTAGTYTVSLAQSPGPSWLSAAIVASVGTKTINFQ